MHRILLVEDDPDVRELLEGVLLDADYAVDATDTVKGGRPFSIPDLTTCYSPMGDFQTGPE